MKVKLKYRVAKKAAWAFMGLILLQAFIPTVAFALTGGPGAPSFSSFEPVATTNMVNDFSGDFTYNVPVLNIPGANGGGYALSLSYHSGGSSEEEASWVGYGWTLNPGAINRGKRGLPDDYNASDVTYYNEVPDNQTVTASANLQPEGFSVWFPTNLSASLSYNNYKGFAYNLGVTEQIGMVSLGFGLANGQTSFSPQISPGAILSTLRVDGSSDVDNNQSQKSTVNKSNNDNSKKQSSSKSEKNKDGSQSSQGGGLGGALVAEGLSFLGSNYGNFSHEYLPHITQFPQYTGNEYNLSVNLMPTLTPLEVGFNVGLKGTYSYQHNTPSTTIPAYGYMYSNNVGPTDNSIMDYSVEKLKPFTKWDTHIGIPYSSADEFMVTGEGIEGGFRLHNSQTGWFHPAPIESSMNSYNIAPSVEIGGNDGGGATLGVGFQNLSITNDWDATQISDYPFAGAATTLEPYFFSFDNDLGGEIDFGHDAPDQATWKSELLGLNYTPIVNTTEGMNGASRAGRSSYIAYHTNSEMTATENGNVYEPYARGNYISQYITRSESDISSGIGEFASFNQDGNLYSYGLPVYSRNETNLQYNLDATAGNVVNNYLVYEDINSPRINTKVGEEMDGAYANNYLLTSITTPDYVDRTMDGPTDDDYGGWTKFIYKQLWGSVAKNGSTSNWYHWRSPYTGLLYHANSLSTQTDDVGTVTSGYKEVYYLDTIQTKTHFAVFRTSSRDDGYDAADDATAANSQTAMGSHSLVRLNRIDLYARNNGKPQIVESVHFEYDTTATELCKGMPNARFNSATGANHGKLTLKRIWFDYNGTINARISPYEFDYAYSQASYPSPYTNTYGSLYTAQEQNPNYSYYEIDPWGNYQDSAAAGGRYSLMKNWVNQRPPNTFDPAAWQLKVIKLPSGGEIHIEYEQKDYSYVQDQQAEAMVSLLGPKSNYATPENTGSDILNNIYYLQLHDVGIDSTNIGAVDSVASLINTTYVQAQKKIYFKYLYALVGQNPAIGPCNSDYITGYSDIYSVGVQKFSGSPNYYRPYVKLGNSSIGLFSGYFLPRNVGINFYETQRMGNMNPWGNCDPSQVGVNMNNKTPEDIVLELLTFLGSAVGGSLVICDQLNFSESYLRIPVPQSRAKKGGGMRVKKLLMYDPGIENGDAVLYGNQYIYKTEAGYSSGVALNEPTAIREENALVQFDPQQRQSFLDKVIGGVDKDMCEIPYYESILPGASIGYSRVIVQNIYSGNTNPGFSVDEYYTAKDYPITAQVTPLNTQKSWLVIPAFLANYARNDIWTSQGFSFTTNSMHGQIKSQTTYEGNAANISQASISTQQVYNYYQPGEQIPMMSKVNNIYYSDAGKEMETVMESRGVEDINNAIAVQFDIDIGLVPPFIVIPFSSICPSYDYSESKLYTHATTKVIKYPAVVKSVYSYADGISHTTQNLAFSPITGKTVLTRTTDGFSQLNLQKSSNHNGNYTSYTFPAAQEYPEMGQRAANERSFIASNSSVEITKVDDGGSYYLQFTPLSGDVCSVTNLFTGGDLIKLTQSGGSTDYGVFTVDSLDVFNSTNLWLLPTAAYGTNTNTGDVDIQIIHSGYTNQLSETTGSFTVYGDTSTVSNISLAGRMLLAHRIDSIYQRGGGIISGTNLPVGVDIINPYSGDCVPLKDSVNSIRYDEDLIIHFKTGIEECRLPPASGYIAIDPITDNLAFYLTGNNCTPIFTCLTLCPTPYTTIDVVQAEAKTYNDTWPYNVNIYPTSVGTNEYENGAKGKWRVQSDYTYKDTIISANGTNQRIYANAGVFPLEIFNWQNPSFNDTTKWIKLNTVTQYSPDGNSLEEEDITGIYSAAKFGYHHTQPYLVAKNSDYGSSMFESFENIYGGDTLEDAWVPGNSTFVKSHIDSTTAHAGICSWKQVAHDSINLQPTAYTAQMQNTNYWIRLWIQDTTTKTGIPISGRITNTDTATSSTIFNFSYVARTGNWTMYEATLDSVKFAQAVFVGDTFTISIKNNYTTATNWIDDLRAQPAEAEMNSYVYDNRLRLVTSFDDQNFGMFYQYNAEGKLVRKKIETIEGIRTVSESELHSHEQLLK